MEDQELPPLPKEVQDKLKALAMASERYVAHRAPQLVELRNKNHWSCKDVAVAAMKEGYNLAMAHLSGMGLLNTSSSEPAAEVKSDRLIVEA